MTIVVATEDFELYHGVVNELRDRSVGFTTIQPGDPLPNGTAAVITTAADGLDLAVPTVYAEAAEPRAAVTAALRRVRGEGRRIVGVDPGTKPGIAVLDGEDVVAAFQVPLSDAASVIRSEVEDAADPLVRIGDGARLDGSQLIEELNGIPIELIDETATTPHLGTGTRGMGDVLAAVNIARREGERIGTREIEPTAGEIKVIKTASRERSPHNREITADLARQVAVGDLSIDEALDVHRDD